MLTYAYHSIKVQSALKLEAVTNTFRFRCVRRTNDTWSKKSVVSVIRERIIQDLFLTFYLNRRFNNILLITWKVSVIKKSILIT